MSTWAILLCILLWCIAGGMGAQLAGVTGARWFAWMLCGPFCAYLMPTDYQKGREFALEMMTSCWSPEQIKAELLAMKQGQFKKGVIDELGAWGNL